MSALCPTKPTNCSKCKSTSHVVTIYVMVMGPHGAKVTRKAVKICDSCLLALADSAAHLPGEGAHGVTAAFFLSARAAYLKLRGVA